jgi:glycerophosphoryl diester phosphodiesterase
MKDEPTKTLRPQANLSGRRPHDGAPAPGPTGPVRFARGPNGQANQCQPSPLHPSAFIFTNRSIRLAFSPKRFSFLNMALPLMKIIAHRGASAEALENTLESFELAIELGAPWIELDVQLSAAGEPLVHHDPIPYPLPHVPTLKEALQCVAGRAGLMVELKEDRNNVPLLIQRVIDLVSCYKGPLLLGSLSPTLLRHLAEVWPAERLVAIVEQAEDLDPFLALNPGLLALSHSLVATHAAPLRQRGFPIWAWTVDDATAATLLAQQGVDGLITNRPRELLDLFSVD